MLRGKPVANRHAVRVGRRADERRQPTVTADRADFVTATVKEQHGVLAATSGCQPLTLDTVDVDRLTIRAVRQRLRNVVHESTPFLQRQLHAAASFNELPHKLETVVHHCGTTSTRRT
jgi:hypothetical protein